MELRAKQRMHALDEAIIQNALLSRKMAAYDASQLGIQIGEEPDVGQIIDESDNAMDRNFIRQQFEKNAFRLFRNNTVSAQNFIGLFAESDYARFNLIFPQLLADLGGLLNIDVRAAFNMARTLMTTKAPKEQAADERAFESDAEAAKKLDTPEVTFRDRITYKEMARCLLAGCAGSAPYQARNSNRQKHRSSVRHINSVLEFQGKHPNFQPARSAQP